MSIKSILKNISRIWIDESTFLKIVKYEITLGPEELETGVKGTLVE